MTNPTEPTITVSCRNPNCVNKGVPNVITLPSTALGQNMMVTERFSPIFCATCGWEAWREPSDLAKDDSKAKPAHPREPELPESRVLAEPE